MKAVNDWSWSLTSTHDGGAGTRGTIRLTPNSDSPTSTLNRIYVSTRCSAELDSLRFANGLPASSMTEDGPVHLGPSLCSFLQLLAVSTRLAIHWPDSFKHPLPSLRRFIKCQTRPLYRPVTTSVSGILLILHSELTSSPQLISFHKPSKSILSYV